MSIHDDLPALLRCPACPPNNRLKAPTTLHCGHTVCAAHVQSSSRPDARLHHSPPPAAAPQDAPHTVPLVPSCPLPTCQRPSARTPSLDFPSHSAVAYYPPLISSSSSAASASSSSSSTPSSSSSSRVTVPEPRIDVSVARILDLLDGASPSGLPPISPPSSAPDDNDEDDNDDDENVVTQGGLSSHRRSSRSRPHARSHPNSPSPSPPAAHRKRLRNTELSDGIHHTARSPSPEDRFLKDLAEAFTCEICFMLLYQPVTTPCQHTFCAKCLQRTLDHATTCPLCRRTLPPFSYFQEHPYNKVLLAMLLKAFPEMYTARGEALEDEERANRLKTPIFVCQLSFPGIPTLLHFFEPRYRLMLRRCLQSPTPAFGMIMPPRVVGSAFAQDYGTMLEIRSVQMLPDGRSMVETWGAQRFRILESATLDGYMVGRIERIDDIPPELEEQADRNLAALYAARARTRVSAAAASASASETRDSETSASRSPSPTPDGVSTSLSTSTSAMPALQPTTEELIAICHAFVQQLRNGTAPWVVQRLNNTYGPMPSDTSSFSFWMGQVLPIDEHEKAKLLVIRSTRGRLRLVVHWIEQLNSNWWFSRGCSIC